MSEDPINDSGTVLDEGRFGYAEPFDTSGDFRHLPPAERRAAKKRSYDRKLRWARAHAIRATWTDQQFEQEARQIAAQIEEWERRHAA